MLITILFTGGKKMKKGKARNFVHKHDVEFNHAKVFDDRKKKHRNGYKKHKGGNDSAPFDFGASH